MSAITACQYERGWDPVQEDGTSQLGYHMYLSGRLRALQLEPGQSAERPACQTEGSQVGLEADESD